MIYRVNWISTKGTLEVVNTQHVFADGDAWLDPDPTPQEVADEIYANIGLHYRNMLDDSYTLDRLDVTTVTDPNQPDQVPLSGSHAVGVAGNRASTNEDLPPRIGGLITWRTGLGGRNFRGRMFCPPLESSAEVEADLIKSGQAYSNAINNFAAAVQVGNLSSGSGWSTAWIDTWHGKFVVYSPTRHKLGLSPIYAVITAGTFNRRFAYLSSRDT